MNKKPIKIINTFVNAKKYLEAVKEENSNQEKLWHEYMIEPFWGEIAQYAPFDVSSKQPKPVQDVMALEKQITEFEKVELQKLQLEFERIAEALPSDDEDPMFVALYPICDSQSSVKNKQNGVVGEEVFGNVILNINPLAVNFDKWISYVFAHEYQHNLWGHHWYVVKGGQGLSNSFLEYLITEGQADLFAMSMYPDLEPQWNRLFDDETTKQLWSKVEPILDNTERFSDLHAKYMFGNEEEELPWCMGYTFGLMIVSDYMSVHSEISFSELIEVSAKEMFEASRFS